MTQEKKIDCLSVATRIMGFQIDTPSLDAIVGLYELVLQKEGKVTLSDIITLREEITKKYEPEQVEEKAETQ